MGRVTNSPAIVLRHVNYRESDRIVTLFTRERGRISGLARGVRRSVKRFAGRLDLFTEIELTYREGRDLYHLESAELISANIGIRDDLLRLAWAGYLSGLVERLYGEAEPHQRAYHVLSTALRYLSEAGEVRESVLRISQLHMLMEAGLLPELEGCVGCRCSLEPPTRFSFIVNRGGPMCERCEPLESGRPVSVETLRGLAEATALLPGEFAIPQWSQELCVEARGVLGAFFTYHVGAPPRSAAFLEEILGVGAPPGSAPERLQD